jgi:hypothetical protein
MLIYLFKKIKNPNLICAGYKNITLHFEILLLISNNYLGKILKFSSFATKQKTEEKEYGKKNKNLLRMDHNPTNFMLCVLSFLFDTSNTKVTNCHVSS